MKENAAGHAEGLAGPVSLYCMLENCRCVDLTGTAHRIGVSVRPAITAAAAYRQRLAPA